MNKKIIIEIVPADRGWILEKMALEIEKYAKENCSEDFDVKIVDIPTDNADITFFLPESAYRDMKKSITLTYLAHKEEHEGAAKLFEKIAKNSDYCVTSSNIYQKQLYEDGAKKVFKVHLGTDLSKFTPKIRIGVVGRTYNTGRKGETLLADVIDNKFLEFVFTGDGWPYPSRYYDDKEMIKFYHQIDYLLIPSFIEGGPVPLLEALASGVPVISPTDIGLVEDFPHISFKKGDSQDLKNVLDKIIDERLLLRDSVKQKDWKNFAEEHIKIFREIYNDNIHDIKNNPLNCEEKSMDLEKPRICLVTHGTEEKTKGGPTTRVKFLKNRLEKDKYEVVQVVNIDQISIDDFDIFHVFNVWPLKSALKTILKLKKKRKKVVFSPIFLDLKWFVFYFDYLKGIFEKVSKNELYKYFDKIKKYSKELNLHDDCLIYESIDSYIETLYLCIKNSDKIVCLSEKEKNIITKINLNADCEVIPNFADENIFGKDHNIDFKSKYNLNRYFINVGRLEYRKNQVFIANALKDSEVKIVFIGEEGDLGYKKYIKKFGSNNLVFIDRTENRELLAAALQQSDGFILPSWTEGGPLSAIEAGMCGIPLILSTNGSELDYFKNFAYYLEPYDYKQIQKYVKKILETPLSEEERKKRRDFFIENYNFEKHYKKTLDVYYSIYNKEFYKDEEKNYINISTVIHYLRSKMPLTGVPRVEFEIINKLYQDKNTIFVRYNDWIKRFNIIEKNDVSNFNIENFDSKYIYGLSGFFKIKKIKLEKNLIIKEKNVEIKESFKNKLKRKIKKIIKLMPKNIQKINQDFIKIFIKDFNADILYTYDDYKNDTLIKLERKELNKGIEEKDLKDIIAISDYYISKLYFKPNNRIIDIGQSWISNHDLLNELLINVNKFELNLYTYVYDLTYLTGAHLSGWINNNERKEKLFKILKYSKKVFTESIETEEELEWLKKIKGYNYVTSSTLLSCKNYNECEKINVKDVNKDFILYVASFNKRKNHDFLINVWIFLYENFLINFKPDIQLVLVGESQEEKKYEDVSYRNYLKKYNILILNNLEEGKIAWLYNRCMFTVFPSLMEGWGLPVQESLIMNKICLVSDSIPVAKNINNPGLIKLEVNNFFDWYNSLKTWIEKDNLRVNFENKTKEYVLPKWEEISDRILN